MPAIIHREAYQHLIFQIYILDIPIRVLSKAVYFPIITVSK